MLGTPLFQGIVYEMGLRKGPPYVSAGWGQEKKKGPLWHRKLTLLWVSA